MFAKRCDFRCFVANYMYEFIVFGQWGTANCNFSDFRNYRYVDLLVTNPVPTL